jgi:hypothetical protein
LGIVVLLSLALFYLPTLVGLANGAVPLDGATLAQAGASWSGWSWYVNASITRAVPNGNRWSEEVFSLRRLQRVPVQGIYARVQLGSGDRWLLVKAADGEVPMGEWPPGGGHYAVGALVEAGVAHVELDPEHFFPYLLDLSWSKSAVPQVGFLVSLLVGIGLFVRELARLRRQHRFPITHPLMATLAAYGNPVTVMRSLNEEVQPCFRRVGNGSGTGGKRRVLTTGAPD